MLKIYDLYRIYNNVLHLFVIYSIFKLGFHFFVAGFTKKSKHILLIRLYSGLIEGINSEKIAGHRASKFKEINKITERTFGSVFKV